MAFFARAVDSLAWSDLAHLASDEVVENVRLEFKRDAPARHETLKKLSSFANTHGGDLLVGAEADREGKLMGLPGVPSQPNFKQKVIQWCYEGLSPPLTPWISSPIEGPSGTVCYVIRVPHSPDAPHFINGRHGCYVRTDEFSQRFEPRPATYSEIAHLADRRVRALSRRSSLRERAEHRFEISLLSDYPVEEAAGVNKGATLRMWLSPLYPTTRLVDDARLEDLLDETRIDASGTTFPFRNAVIVRQHESVLAVRPTLDPTLYELGVWGNLFYGASIESVGGPNSETARGVWISELAAKLLLFIGHAAAVYPAMGYDGPLSLRFELHRIYGVTFWRPREGSRLYHSPDPSSPYDASIDFEFESDTRLLLEDLPGTVGRALQVIGFGVNWGAVEHELEHYRLVENAYGRLRWTIPMSEEEHDTRDGEVPESGAS